MPSLRYAGSDSWYVYRWRTGFHDLCAALVRSDHWPDQGGAHCWGDEHLALRAQERQGPGNPARWRAWGTSHHLMRTLDLLVQRQEVSDST